MGKEDASEMISLIKDLQKRMTYLEKKIDILVKQSSERTSTAKSFSRGPKNNNTRDRRYEAKNARSGPSDESRRWSKGQVFPKKNQAFNPDNKKRLDKSK